MISAQRLLLLRRLANAPKTATKILHHRTISISGSCPTNLAAGRHPSLGRAVHLHASSFSTSAAAEGLAAEETKEEDAISEDDKTTFLTTNDETTVTMTTSRTSSEDIEDAPPPMEILSGDFTDTSAPESNNMDENFHGIPPEKIIRTGKIEWIDFKRMYGVILQDEPYRNLGMSKQDTVFFYFHQIYPEHYLDDKIKLEPYIDKSRRIRFQARQCPRREGVLNGFNLRYVDEVKVGVEEGLDGSASGGDIALLHWKGALTMIQSAKARLGWNVFDLLSNASLKEDKALATKVENEIEVCNKRIEWARKVLNNREKATRECRAKLGEELYDMLSNIDKVDNIQRRADEAYFRCRNELSTLGLSLEPNKIEEQDISASGNIV